MISIIIPTLNELTHLPLTLQTVFQLKGTFEVIVVDGGSTDGTLQMLTQWPELKVLATGTAERAGQMNAGARLARGHTLWFLHADTRVPANSLNYIAAACRSAEIVGGSFRMAFDRPNWPYPALSFFTRFNSRFWTFGDQGIFVKKAVFEELGGYASVGILEDLELQLRLRNKGTFVKIPLNVTTSARRYVQGGFWREIGRDMCTVAGYFLGLRIPFLEAWYRKDPD